MFYLKNTISKNDSKKIMFYFLKSRNELKQLTFYLFAEQVKYFIIFFWKEKVYIIYVLEYVIYIMTELLVHEDCKIINVAEVANTNMMYSIYFCFFIMYK